MPYLQLELPCRRDAQPRIERALEDAGALSVTLQDAHLDAIDEQLVTLRRPWVRWADRG